MRSEAMEIAEGKRPVRGRPNLENGLENGAARMRFSLRKGVPGARFPFNQNRPKYLDLPPRNHPLQRHFGERMRILLTNDDGVLSPVLYRTADALAVEHEVVVAAPAQDQSGKAHAFTHGPDKLLTCRLDGTAPWPLYRVDGTPADCVKFAVSHLLRDRLPALVLSGPNLGENAGVSAVYSGTVAAAREGALWGIPALAVSLAAHGHAHLEYSLEWLLALLRRAEDLPAPGTLWNVNFPACPVEEIAGSRFARMSTVMFRDRYEEAATRHGIPGYRLEGYKPAELFEPGTDDDLLRRNYIAVAPLRVSQADEAALESLKGKEARLNAAAPAAPLPDSAAAPAP
jgi:5'-nucleotidase